MHHHENSFSLAEVIKTLNGKPNTQELKRLAEHYPTYSLPHRKVFLEDFFYGLSDQEILINKFKIKGLDPNTFEKAKKGGEEKWPRHKSRGLLIRLLYLRLIFDSGETSTHAINSLTYRYGSQKAKDPKNSIRVLLRKKAINLPK